jgi:hypothetical protein
MAAPRGDKDHGRALRFATAALTQARDDLASEIVDAAREGGMSYRAIAAEVGLSHGQVALIVKGEAKP